MPTEVVQLQQQGTGVATKQSTEERRHVFKRKNKKVKKENEDAIKDAREPNIKFYHHLKILQIFGWNLIFVGIGAIGCMAYGLIPVM